MFHRMQRGVRWGRRANQDWVAPGPGFAAWLASVLAAPGPANTEANQATKPGPWATQFGLTRRPHRTPPNSPFEERIGLRADANAACGSKLRATALRCVSFQLLLKQLFSARMLVRPKYIGIFCEDAGFCKNRMEIVRRCRRVVIGVGTQLRDYGPHDPR